MPRVDVSYFFTEVGHWKGAKPTQLTLTFKGASTLEGCGVLGVISIPLPTPRTSMLLRFRLRGITGGCL